uniref:Uncharacterized protein n=1 Tax=Arundo donax TaxID=35708 RepID=A0A0A9AWW5_ARUDO
MPTYILCHGLIGKGENSSYFVVGKDGRTKRKDHVYVGRCSISLNDFLLVYAQNQYNYK